MSTHWQKYCSTAEEAREKARKPDDNGVISATAGPIRRVPMTVEHSPDIDFNDRSHTDVIGEKTAEARLKLLEIFQWAIRVT